MQRLLRGRALYVAFGLFVLGLYARQGVVHLESPATPPQAPPPAAETVIGEVDVRALQQAAQQRPGLGVFLVVLSLVAVGIGLAGWAMSIDALVRGRLHTLWRMRPGGRLPSWSWRELWRVLALIALVGSLLPFIHVAMAVFGPWAELDANLWTTLSMVGLDAFVVLVIVAFAAGKRVSLGRLFGWTGRRRGQAIAGGLVGYIATFPWLLFLVWVVAATWRRLGWELPIEPIHELVFLESRPFVVGLTVLLACALGPVAEELFFRGLLYGVLRHRVPRVAAMLISGAAFAGLHGTPIGFIPITTLGCLLAVVYERTGSLIAPIAVHIVHNTLLMSLALVLRGLLEAAP